MSFDKRHAQAVASPRELVEHLATFETAERQWRTGLEREVLLYRRDGLRPVPYAGLGGVADLLSRLRRPTDEPVYESEHLIGLDGGASSVSLEPGGQLELATAPHTYVADVERELTRDLGRATEIARELGIGLLAMAFPPTWTRSDVFWVPRSRYAIMRAYMPRVGARGLDMMGTTCSTQVSLDFADEADMVRKMRVATALSPVVSALFACSPFARGRPAGVESVRGEVWLRTDEDRCGVPEVVFEDGFGYERWVDWALDVPMYSVDRGAAHLDTAGESFRAFLDGALPAMPGERPTMRDWMSHLNTLMPEARLKNVIELRGADAGSVESSASLAALWTGLLYDRDALEGAHDLVRAWGRQDRVHLRRQVPRVGLALAFDGRPLTALAQQVVALARAGLERREPASGTLLDPVQRAAESGHSPATCLLEAFSERWDGEPGRLIADCSLS